MLGSESQAKVRSVDHSLAPFLGDGPADSSVLRIFRRVLVALEAIYAAGASHPPLSPQTIRLDASGQPRIQSSNRTHENADTIAFGSAKYCAPEAFLHGNDCCSEVVDCYVLGFIFYEILIGKRLFLAQFASLENGPPALWLRWHADKTLKARPLRELVPNLGHFANLIDRMIEKDPNKRINSIAQVLQAFSIAEAQTTYRSDPVLRPAASPKFHFERVRKKLARQFAAFRKLRLVAGALVAGIAIILAAVLVHRDIRWANVRQPVSPVLPLAIQPPKPGPKAVQPLPSATHEAEVQTHVSLQPEVNLQIESHLRSSALLFLDDLQPVALPQHASLTQKISPGPHKFRFVTRAKAYLELPLNIGASGDVSFLKLPKARSLRYVMLASNAKSTKLYATPEARAGLPGQDYQSVPEHGWVVADSQIVNVSFGQDDKAEIHLNALRAGSLRILLEPREAPLLVPVEISANVPDADIVINGETLTHKLDNGVRVVRLPAGEYRVKLVRADYQDSAEQHLVISSNDQPRKLQFTLSPVMTASNAVVSSVPAHDSTTAGSGPKVDDRATRPSGKITFHVRPESAKISVRREGDSRTQDCANNETCLLPAGAYEVTAQAQGFKTGVSNFAVGAGDDKPYESKLDAVLMPSALNPANFFENGKTWTVDHNGWWTHTQPGYSFMRANQGVFVFDIHKPSGLFVSKKVSLVVDYKSDTNRVLYTIDEHKLRRDERGPGIPTADYFVLDKTSPEANYRLTLKLSSDRVIIYNAAGQVLDNLPLTNAASGKVGFSGKLKLRVIEARYSQ